MTATTLLMLSQINREIEVSDGGMMGPIILIIYVAIAVLYVVGVWKTFTKAGKPGWACIIPIYNFIVMLEIAGRPLWWILLLLIPFVNLAIFFIVSIDIAKSFGQSALFGIGLVLLSFVFYPILGFGDARYHGPAAAQ